MRVFHILATLIMVTVVFIGCPDDDVSGDDDDTTSDDDTQDDDSQSDDDTGDDDSAGDDDAEPVWAGWNEAPLDEADASIYGENVGDWLGGGLVVPGDMNGDGIVDVAISAPYYSEHAEHGGKVYVLFGRTNGWTVGENPETFPSVVSDVEQHELWNVKWAGDVDADGLADLLIPPEHVYADGVDHQYLLLGRTSGWMTSMPVMDLDARTTIATSSPGSSEIVTQGYLGDVDGDGHDDWLLSSRWSMDMDGQAIVISGAAIQSEIELPTDAQGWLYGSTEEFVTVTPLKGDINGDGLADLGVHPDLDLDYLYLLLGRNGGFPHGEFVGNVADSVFDYSGSGTGLGRLGCAGDINGDGIDDLVIALVSGEDGSDQGSYIFFGRSIWPSVLLESDAEVVVWDYEESAEVANSPGDVNGDGIDDLLFQIDRDMYLVFGRSTGWASVVTADTSDVKLEPATWMGEWDGYRGLAVSGDLDGDGFNEVFLETHDSDDYYNGVMGPGALHVFAGRSSWPSNLTADEASASFVGARAYENVGYPGRTVLADINADGKDDILMSTFRRPVETQGGVYIFFGHERTP